MDNYWFVIVGALAYLLGYFNGRLTERQSVAPSLTTQDEHPYRWKCPECKGTKSFTISTNYEAGMIQVRDNHLAVFHSEIPAN